jgi:predicted RND superfamily exporter protein
MIKIARVAMQRPKLVFVASLFVLAASLFGAKDLVVNADTRTYFSQSNPHLLELQAFEKTYRPNNNILFVIDTGDRDVFTPDVLAAVQDLTEQAWRLPNALQVDSLTNFPFIYSEEDDFILEDLIPEGMELSQTELAHRKASALADPLLVNRLISPDARVTAINVNFLLPERGSTAIKEINDAAQHLIAKVVEDHPTINVSATGNVVLMRAFTTAALSDMFSLLPISLIAILTIVFIVLRSGRESIAISLMILVVAGLSVGLGGWAGFNIDQSTAVAPVIIMTLCMASSLHIVTYAKRTVAQGTEPKAAILASLSHNLHPIFLTSLTTMVGFLSFNFADAPPFRDLGNLVAIGIALNFGLTLVLLPALLSGAGISAKSSPILALTKWFGEVSVTHARALVILGPVFVIFVSTGISKIELDDDFIRYFGPKYEYRTASDFAEEKLTGLNIIEFSVPAEGPGGVYSPDYQRKLRAFSAWLKLQPKVISAATIVEITKRIDQTLSPNEAPTWAIPEDKDLIAQYFLLYEMSLPFGKDITDQIDIDRSASRVNVILKKATSSDVRRLKAKAEHWLSENLKTETSPRGTSINVLFAYLSVVNIEKMLIGTFFSFLIISVIIAAALRSISYGMLSLVTNMLPAFAGFGIWGILFGQINLAAAVITAMTLGIVVDDTIHYLMNYKRLRGGGMKAEEAVRAATGSVGGALLVTTISLVVGFLVLSFSDFQVNQTLGVFTAIILVTALIMDILILPAVLIRFDDRLHSKMTN